MSAADQPGDNTCAICFAPFPRHLSTGHAHVVSGLNQPGWTPSEEAVEAALSAWAEDCGVQLEDANADTLDLWRGNVRVMLTAARDVLESDAAREVESTGISEDDFECICTIERRPCPRHALVPLGAVERAMRAIAQRDAYWQGEVDAQEEQLNDTIDQRDELARVVAEVRALVDRTPSVDAHTRAANGDVMVSVDVLRTILDTAPVVAERDGEST